MSETLNVEADRLEGVAISVFEATNPGMEWFDLDRDVRRAGIAALGKEISETMSENQTLDDNNGRLNAECERLRNDNEQLTTVAERNIARSAAYSEIHPHDTSAYRDQTCNVFLTQVFNGLQFGFGISPRSVTTEFRDMMDTIITQEYPTGLRRSALRQVIEGDLTGGRCPVSAIPMGLASRVARILGFADACETVLYRVREESKETVHEQIADQQ